MLGNSRRTSSLPVKSAKKITTTGVTITRNLGKSSFAGTQQYASGSFSGQTQKKRIRTTKGP